MVLEIRIRNFFSIKDEIVLDFRAAKMNTQAAKVLENNIFSFDKTQVLKTVALYGANASGKSSIIKAIRFCNAMVFESHRHNEDTVCNFEPFKFKSCPKKPSFYFIRFVSNKVEYEYSFSLTRTEIITESLYYYPKGRIAKIFSRNEHLGNTKKEKYSFGSVIRRPLDVAESTSNKTLFISRASQMDRLIPKEIFKYFNETFILGYRGHNARSVEALFTENKALLLKTLKIADSDIVDIKLRKEVLPGKNVKANLSTSSASVEDVEQEHLRITTFHRSSEKVPFDFFTEESAGTIKLFFIMLTILDIIKNNKILLIDEIGESLHTSIIEYIIELFNAGKQAQLIYTTHNTKLLNLRKLRKDQIFFVNKKEDASTDLYSLYDYSDFRDTMDVEKAYLQGRFDAIPFIGERFGRGRGVKYVLSRRYYKMVDEKGTYTRKKGLDRETNKALLLKHIRGNRYSGSRLKELLQVLPSLSKDQVQKLVAELKKEKRIYMTGSTKAALWYPVNSDIIAP